MSVRHLVPALVLTLALAVAGLPAEAQRRGGGSRGGSNGGSHGGGAVSRQPSGGPRTGAQARHPRPGTGSGGYYYGGRYGGRYGGYYGSYYRPYYGGYYAPYYGSGFYGSLSFGWPSYYSSWPYYSSGYSYNPGYDASYYAAPPTRVYDDRPSEAPPRDLDRSSDSDRDSGRIRLEVRPEDTSVYIDDAFRGTAREAKGLSLPPGRHTLELVRPGYVTERRELEIVTRARQDVLVEMQRR